MQDEIVGKLIIKCNDVKYEYDLNIIVKSIKE